VGGTDTVRGFDQYRFRSGSALLLNLEYRQEWKGLLDTIVFADAGRVVDRPSDLGLRRGLRGAAGLGARVRLGGRVFIGVDLGFSRDGPELWFRSGHVF
jgi:hemolysin activation/secretion protein